MGAAENQNQDFQKDRVDMKWVFISGAIFLVLLGVTVLFMYYGLHLVGADKAILYFIILSVLGVFSATFLFRVLKSYALLKTDISKYNLELGGPAVIFVLVIAGGYKFYHNPPAPSIYDLTVFFSDVQNPAKLLDGSATVRYGSLSEKLEVRNGECVKKLVEPRKSIEINANIHGYTSINGNKFITPSDSNTIMVNLKQDSVFDARRRVYAREISSMINKYLSDAQDVRNYLTDELDSVFERSDVYNAFIDAAIRYNESYTRMDSAKSILPKDILNYLTADSGSMQQLFDQFDQVHSGLYLGLNFNIDEINAYVNSKGKDKALKQRSEYDINKKLRDTKPEFEVFERHVKAVQSELIF